jgi:uncharacterized protein YjbI with pentapeptide repeats/DNA-binding XRE family transcriptional regulator
MINAIQIGEKIAIARKLKNMSQADVAGKMALTTQAIGKWERGESMPDAVTFIRLSGALGVEPNYFIGSEAPPGSRTEALPESENTRKSGRDMSGACWENADFSGLKDIGEKFSGVNIEKCRFIKADLSKLTIRGNNMQSSDFSKSSFTGSHFWGCNIQSCVFESCDLTGSECSGSNISGCSFDGANFSDAVFSKCRIEKASVAAATWRNTGFRETALADMALSGEIIGCYFENSKMRHVTFRDAVLKNTFFKNCNLKKLRFENVSADTITLAFLKSSKADISGIKHT